MMSEGSRNIFPSFVNRNTKYFSRCVMPLLNGMWIKQTDTARAACCAVDVQWTSRARLPSPRPDVACAAGCYKTAWGGRGVRPVYKEEKQKEKMSSLVILAPGAASQQFLWTSVREHHAPDQDEVPWHTSSQGNGIALRFMRGRRRDHQPQGRRYIKTREKQILFVPLGMWITFCAI